MAQYRRSRLNSFPSRSNRFRLRASDQTNGNRFAMSSSSYTLAARPAGQTLILTSTTLCLFTKNRSWSSTWRTSSRFAENIIFASGTTQTAHGGGKDRLGCSQTQTLGKTLKNGWKHTQRADAKRCRKADRSNQRRPRRSKLHWHTVRLAGIDLLEDLQYVCIPTEQRWINDCSSWEIGSWRHARTITKES